MKIASWNVNSIRQRLSHVQKWLQKEQPDWLFLQEIKCQNAQFPSESFKALDYHVIVHGQKAYNGVATLSRHPYKLLHTDLPDLQNTKDHARYLEIESRGIHLCNLYLPNGNSGGEEGFQFKMDFINALIKHAQSLLNDKQNCIFAGDFNICPTDSDLTTNILSSDDALIRPESRKGFYTLLWLGLSDAFRILHPDTIEYSFWDYTKAAWQRNAGLRIDHVLLSAKITEQLKNCWIDKEERAKTQPSDHAPIVIEF